MKKTNEFHLPVQHNRQGNYKMPSGTFFMTCFTSDFFHPAADVWRLEARAMMKERHDCHFYFITKRPERFYTALPDDWQEGYDNVTICCTCENQYWTDQRLPVFLNLPIRHKEIIHEPLLETIDISSYLKRYHNEIDGISAGGESGEGADIRVLRYEWMLNTQKQCRQYHVPFHFHQTGTCLQKDGRLYTIPRRYQRSQAEKAGIDYMPEEDGGISNV